MSDDLEIGGRRALVTRGATGAGRNSDDKGEDFTTPYATEGDAPWRQLAR